MKLLGILLALCVIAVACTAPPSEIPRAQDTQSTGNVIGNEEVVIESQGNIATVPIDMTVSSFTFTGYGPGKSHDGTFTVLDGELDTDGTTIIAARGTIEANSVSTGIKGLDKHLMGKDFFDAEVHPQILMESTQITNGKLKGTLMFRGITKELEFPVNTTANSLSADLIISMKDFGISIPAANDEVRIRLNLVGER
jgi:polyisoprenoid-binding protein YceI